MQKSADEIKAETRIYKFKTVHIIKTVILWVYKVCRGLADRQEENRKAEKLKKNKTFDAQ